MSWVTGALAPAELAALPADVPVLFDGAQGAGAVPVDVEALGCAFYAGAGQKWLCGPVGTGMLWVAPAWRDRRPGPRRDLPQPRRARAPASTRRRARDARRHDASAISAEASALAVAAHDVLADAGWDAVHARATSLAASLARALAERGRTVARRDATTLVAWEEPDPAAAVARLTEAGVALRELPGTPYLRASVGAWNDEDDLDRLLGALD